MNLKCDWKQFLEKILYFIESSLMKANLKNGRVCIIM